MSTGNLTINLKGIAANWAALNALSADTVQTGAVVKADGYGLDSGPIARALYHDPSILVLDEATSSLDGITEEVIIEAINNLSHKKTIIMIAHRLSTVKDCDIIHLMDSGKVIASGTFDYLMDNNEQFRKMAKNS